MKNRLLILKYLFLILVLSSAGVNSAVADDGTGYMFTVTKFRGGTVTVTDNADNEIHSGTTVGSGMELTVRVTPDPGRSIEKLYVNGADVYPQYQPTGSYTFIVNSETTVMPVYDPQICTLTYSYQGAGYIEVWSEQTETDPPEPSGVQYRMGDELPYSSIIHIFPFTYGGGELQSLKVNGDEYVNDPKFIITGNVQVFVDGDIDITAAFSGVSNGVAENITGSTDVYGVQGGIKIKNAGSAAVKIFAVSGTLILSQTVDGELLVPIQPGIYTVSVNSVSYKVTVK